MFGVVDVDVDALLPGRMAGVRKLRVAFVGLAGNDAVKVESVGIEDELLVEICPGRRRGGGRDGFAGGGVASVTFREIVDDCERSPKLPRTLPSTLLCHKPSAGLVRSILIATL